MRNIRKVSSSRPPGRSSVASPRSSSSPPPSAFSASFLLESARRDDPPCSGPPALLGGSFWSGPWEVEGVSMPHGHVWAVVRRGESVRRGGRAVAVTRHRSDALLVAATLPALAVPNHLSLGETAKRLGYPVHDGAECLGHLSRPEPRIVEHLHIARALIGRADALAMAIEGLEPDEIPVLGRALLRRIVAAGAR